MQCVFLEMEVTTWHAVHRALWLVVSAVLYLSLFTHLPVWGVGWGVRNFGHSTCHIFHYKAVLDGHTMHT